MFLTPAEIVRPLLVGGSAAVLAAFRSAALGSAQSGILMLIMSKSNDSSRLAVEREVDQAQVELDAEHREVVLIDGLASTEGVARLEPFELERLALGVAQARRPARPSSPPARAARRAFLRLLRSAVGVEVRARILPRADRTPPAGSSAPEGLEQRKLGRRRQSDRREFRVREQAVCPLVLLVDVDRGEVVRKIQRLAHAAVLEQRLAQIEDVRLQAHAESARKLLLDDPLVIPLGTGVLARPAPRGVFHQEVELARLERLHRDRVVLVIAVDDAIEVVLPLRDTQVARPVVGVALEFDPPRRIDGARSCTGRW